MNRNHYDPIRIYSAKIERILANLQQIKQAQEIFDQVPEQPTQRLWARAIEAAYPAGQKTKTIGKALVKRSIRKTLQSLQAEQEKMLGQVRERLADVNLEAQSKEEVIMDKLREFVRNHSETRSEGEINIKHDL